MKLSILSVLLLLTISNAAQAQSLDEDNTKLRVVEVNGEADCKLSLREINSFDGVTVGKRYLCAQLVEINTEVTISELADLLKQNKVKIEYAGNSAESLINTLNAWREALVKDLGRYVNAEYSVPLLPLIRPYSFQVLARNGNTVTLQIANLETGATVQTSVEMNKQIGKIK